jgi:hypothetical protein
VQAYLEGAVSAALDAVRSAPEGGRRSALNREAFALGGLVPHGLDATALDAALVNAAVAAGLPVAEAVATVRAALADGARTPRSLPAGLEEGPVGRRRLVRPTSAPLPPPAPPVDTAPPEEVRPLLSALWEAMRGDALPPHAVAYLEGRALSPRVAHDAGCRVPTRDQLAEVWQGHGRKAFAAAGLLREKEGGEWVPAWKIHANEGARLWVPVWSPVWPDAPVAYRWRVLWDGARVKALGVKTAAHAWRDWPLGVRWAETLWWGDRSAPAPVVVCEGEPDWLALAEALEPGAAVLAMPGTSGWRDHWWPLLADAPALFVALHDDEAGRRATRSIGRALARAVPNEAERPLRRAMAPPAGGDWNDATRALGRAGVAPLVELVTGALRREEVTHDDW